MGLIILSMFFDTVETKDHVKVIHGISADESNDFKQRVIDRKNPRKYEILTDDSDRVITRSRRHIKAYLTRSGRVSKAPKCLIDT